MDAENTKTSRPRLILVGGFLGAGKTTLLAAVSRILQRQHKTVGLITNDQSTGLVDTRILELGNSRVREISGSCFCCDFQGFMGAVEFLVSHSNCDVVVAEPVGSCTDLSATIVQPVKSLFSEVVDLAPLSVLIDPFEYLAMAGKGAWPSGGTEYIYRKQLEEADYIVLNKTDLLDDKSLSRISRLLADQFPEHPVCRVSAFDKSGIADWLRKIDRDPNAGRRLAEVDYEVYAAAEARTGWYNGSFLVRESGGRQVEWSALHRSVLELLEKVFHIEQIHINHLKTFLKSGPTHLIGNITGNGKGPVVRGNGFCSTSARLVVNLRAETSHILLREIMDDVLETFSEHGYIFDAISVNHLTPGRPQPHYRYRVIT